MTARIKPTDATAGDGQELRSAASTVRGARTAFSDFASITAATALSALLSLVGVIMATHLLGPKRYGILAYYGIVALLVFQAAAGWTAAAVARYGREELEAKGEMRSVTWARWRIVMPLLIVAALVVAGLKAGGVLPRELTWSLVALAIGYGTLLIGANHVISLLNAAGWMKHSAVGNTLQQALYVGILFVIVITQAGASVEVLAVASAFTTGVMICAFLRRVWRIGIWPVQHDSALGKRLLHFAVPLAGFTASQYVIRSVDLIVIRGVLNIASAGVYAVAYQAYSMIQSVTNAASQVFTPLFVSLRARGRDDVIVRYLERTVPQLTFVGAVTCGLLAPWMTVAVRVIFGSRFSAAGPPLGVLLAAAVIFFAANLLAPVILLHEKSRAIALINAAGAAVNIGGDLLLVALARVGIIGAAIATVAALAVITVGYQRLSDRCMGSASPSVLLMILPGAASVASGLIFHGVARIPIGVGLTIFTAVVLQTTVRVFRADDAELLEQLDMPGWLKSGLRRMLAMLAPSDSRGR